MLDMKKKYSLAHGKKLSHTFKLFFFLLLLFLFEYVFLSRKKGMS